MYINEITGIDSLSVSISQAVKGLFEELGSTWLNPKVFLRFDLSLLVIDVIGPLIKLFFRDLLSSIDIISVSAELIAQSTKLLDKLEVPSSIVLLGILRMQPICPIDCRDLILRSDRLHVLRFNLKIFDTFLHHH